MLALSNPANRFQHRLLVTQGPQRPFTVHVHVTIQANSLQNRNRIHIKYDAVYGGRGTFAGRREVGPCLILGASYDLLFVLVWELVAGQAAVDDTLVIVRLITVTCGVLDVNQIRTVNDYARQIISKSNRTN